MFDVVYIRRAFIIGCALVALVSIKLLVLPFVERVRDVLDQPVAAAKVECQDLLACMESVS